MSKIVIGTADGKNVNVSIDELLVSRMLVQANSGGGKSYLLRRILEQAYGKIQAIVIDPAGEFATLREKFGYVLVGEHGETPADIRSAGLVAEKLLELRASAVCDLYSVKPADRHVWVQRFLQAVMNAPKRLWHPVLFVVDEAHKFMPEKGEGESEAKEMMLSLASDGRKYGFCAILATQRLAKLDKSGASEMLNVLVGPTFMDIDLQRAHKALGIVPREQAAFNEQMKTIRPGHFWALGRAISKTRILVKVGAVETTHPTAGTAKYSAEPPPAPDKVKALLPKLADLPKEAEEKARTEAEFRKEVRDLKHRLTVAEKLVGKPVTKEIAKADPLQARVIRDQDQVIKQFRALLEDAMKIIAKINAIGFDAASVNAEEVNAALKKAADEVGRMARQKLEGRALEFERLKTEMNRLLARLNAQLSKEEIQVSVDVQTHTGARPRPTGDPSQQDGNLSKGERAVLIATAQFDEGADKQQLTILTGYKRSTRDAYLQRLAGRQFVEMQGQRVVATETGIAALGSDYEPLPTGDALLQHWIGRLPEGERKILEVLAGSYPQSIDRIAIGESTGYQRSTRDAYLQRLASRKLIENVGGQVRASGELFDRAGAA